MEVLLRNSFDQKTVTGTLSAEYANGKSVATRVFAQYPLKLMIPTKVQFQCSQNLPCVRGGICIFLRLKFRNTVQMAASDVDVLWVYAITYGGGIVSVGR